MKKLFILFFLAAAAFASAGAATEKPLYLTVTQADGTERSYELKDLKITFTASDMQFAEGGTTSTIPLASLAGGKMRFTELATAIHSARAEQTVTLTGGDILTVTMPAAGTLRLYAADGATALAQKLPAGSTAINIARLAKGIYVAKIGSKAIKIEKR